MPLVNGIWRPAEDGPWHPVLSQKQMDLYDEFEHRYVLCTGGRWGSKTVGVVHKVWRHLWETPGARGCMVAKTTKSAKEGGAWQDLLEVAAPEWLESGICGPNDMPIEYTTKDGSGKPGPRIDPTTRTVSFKIRNYYGGESEMLLFSLDNDHEAEAKLKGTRFSLIWFSELANFNDRKVFNTSKESLRMMHLEALEQKHKRNYHLWIGDTNPSEDGDQHWIYKLWFDEIKQDNHPIPSFQRQLKRFDFSIHDNPFLPDEKKEEIKGGYVYDPKEYDRNIDGKWVKGKQGDRHFAHLLDYGPNGHFVEPAIDVDGDTEELFGGWDIGQVNNAAVLLEKIVLKQPARNGEGEQEVSHYNVLDECVVIDEQISTAEFGYQVMDKINALEEYYERRFRWVHWSDDTALNTWRAGVEGYDATIILDATGGRVNLEAVDKPEGSVDTAIKIIKRLLRERRLHVGRNCPHTIQMLEDLKVGQKKSVEDSGNNSLKHIFDALRYPIYMEERRYMEEKLDGHRPKSSLRVIHA